MARSEDTRPTTEEPAISSVNTPLVLALACMSIRLVLSVFWKPTIWGDTPTYVAMAEYIKSWDFSGYLAVSPPGYPLLLLLGGLDFRAIWLIQSFLGIGISVMLYSLTYDQTRSRPWAFAAGLSYSLSINSGVAPVSWTPHRRGEKKMFTMSTSHRPYSPEFRHRTVKPIRKRRTPEVLGRHFEPSAQCIRNWMRRATATRARAD